MNIGPETTYREDDEAPGTPADTSVDPGFEAALRHALRPTDAPTGFADRVLARALAGDTPHPLAPAHSPVRPAGQLLPWPPQSRPWINGLIAGLVAAGLIAGVLEGGLTLHHLRTQQRRAAQATREFQTTERVTDRALAQAREQLQRAGVPLTLD